MDTFLEAYDFSTTTKLGFNATITLLDDTNNNLPISTTGFTAQMVLSVMGSQEFNWSSASANINFSEPGRLIITVPPLSCIPKTFISYPEQYPYQIYNYTLTIFNSNQQIFLIFGGAFTIYMNG